MRVTAKLSSHQRMIKCLARLSVDNPLTTRCSPRLSKQNQYELTTRCLAKLNTENLQRLIWPKFKAISLRRMTKCLVRLISHELMTKCLARLSVDNPLTTRCSPRLKIVKPFALTTRCLVKLNTENLERLLWPRLIVKHLTLISRCSARSNVVTP